MLAGVLDSSGMRFTYINEPLKHRAGVLTLGHNVHSGMIIPPERNDYTITGFCPGSCTQKVHMCTLVCILICTLLSKLNLTIELDSIILLLSK